MQEGHIHLMPTKSGRLLIGAGTQSLTEDEQKEIQTILESNPDAAEKYEQLTAVRTLGVQLKTSASPAFLGLVVANIKSVNIAGCKNPAVQVRCEGDKVRQPSPTCMHVCM